MLQPTVKIVAFPKQGKIKKKHSNVIAISITHVLENFSMFLIFAVLMSDSTCLFLLCFYDFRAVQKFNMSRFSLKLITTFCYLFVLIH